MDRRVVSAAECATASTSNRVRAKVQLIMYMVARAVVLVVIVLFLALAWLSCRRSAVQLTATTDCMLCPLLLQPYQPQDGAAARP